MTGREKAERGRMTAICGKCGARRATAHGLVRHINRKHPGEPVSGIFRSPPPSETGIGKEQKP